MNNRGAWIYTVQRIGSYRVHAANSNSHTLCGLKYDDEYWEVLTNTPGDGIVTCRECRAIGKLQLTRKQNHACNTQH